MSRQDLSFEVYGLGCGGAGATSLERALSKLGGVTKAYVNPLTERAHLEYDPTLTPLEAIQQTVEGLSYQTNLLKPLSKRSLTRG